MSQLTNKKHAEQLNTQLNVQDNHNNTSSEKNEIVSRREPIEGTPFTLAQTEKGYTILLGLYALTPTLKTKKAITDYFKKNEWNIMVNVMHAILNFHGLVTTETLKEKTDQIEEWEKNNKEQK